MLSLTETKRITYKRVRPNPLFQEWLEELHVEAKAKKSKLEPMLNEALQSLSKYPLPLETGAECAILRGFDKRLCLFLDRRLEVYRTRKVSALHRSLQSSPTSNIKNITPPSNSDYETNRSNSPNKKAGHKTYKPSFRSGGYAILLSLLEYSFINPDNPALNKENLIEKAEKYSDESFTQCKPESYYTAWSNMGRLIKKGLVKKSRNKNLLYSLTEQGTELAKELLKESREMPTNNDIIFSEGTLSCQNNNDGPKNSEAVTNPNIVEALQIQEDECSSSDQFIELNSGSFEIILLIDKNEISGLSKKNDPTVAQFNKYPSLKHEYRSLKVGDFTWIARHKTDKGKELILPYIVERKRMDDLGASIKDGRFHEQKFRLRKCGLTHIIYMIENYGSNKHVGLPLNSLMQALANTRVQDGFKVHVTDSLSNSARFLAMMSRRLTIEYEKKDLKGTSKEPKGDELMLFDFFNKASAKTKALTVTEMFIKLLLQLKGMSVEKALAITSLYNTPKSLIKEYDKCNKKEGEMLLANLKYGSGSRNVGPSVSKSIYQFFSNKDLI